MPMLSQTSSYSIKVVLISTIFLSAGILLKFSFPAFTDFPAYELPSIYNGVVSWLRPPYLYLVINCIIISIFASFKLQSRKDGDVSLSTPSQPPQTVAVKDTVQADEYYYDDVVVLDSNDSSSYENVAPSVIINAATSDGGDVFEDDTTIEKENEYNMITKSTWNAPHRKDTKGYSPVSARFGNRRNLKASPEGGKAVLGVSKPKKHDTLESTWKTITEGRAMPLTRHLRKNETWEKTNPPKVIMTENETFNDLTNARSPLMAPSPGSGKLRKKPSLSQDELNRRVEAFIKKFNQEMRLQRQESLNNMCTTAPAKQV